LICRNLNKITSIWFIFDIISLSIIALIPISLKLISNITILTSRSLCMHTCICCTYKPVTCSRINVWSNSILAVSTICTVGSILSILTILSIFNSSNRCPINIYCGSTSTLRSSYYRTMSILSRSSVLSRCTIRTILTSRALFSLNALFSLWSSQSFKLSCCKISICKRISFISFRSLYTLWAAKRFSLFFC
jgi:hypothetical protein